MATAKRAVLPAAKRTATTSSTRRLETPVPALRSPQDGPVLLRGASQRVAGAVKIDSAVLSTAGFELDGWLVGEGSIKLECAGVALDCKVSRKPRPDVAAAMRLPEPEPGFGFTLRAPRATGTYVLKLEQEVDGETQRLSFPLRVQRPPVLGPGGAAGAIGFLEAASASTLTEEGIVLGWAVSEPDAMVWLETDAGTKCFLDGAYRYSRDDVFRLHTAAFGGRARESGFAARIAGVSPGSLVRLMSQKDSGPVVVSEIAFGSLPADPAAASQWLFGMATPASQLTARYPLVDAPVIEALVASAQRGWSELPVVSRVLGPAKDRPLASVVVPLYGRCDFVEHQLMEFSRDPALCEAAELVYVIDDPQLVEPFLARADWLYQLYGVPFRWVWGGVNRGFSGANNLGATQSGGEYLVFVNSDVIPQGPGWLMPMIELLRRHPAVGAVGPRLTFADGSIQHAGMAFRRREDLGVWINEHPQMGVDPSLDRYREPTTMPAVTGACLAMRRKDFDAVGGWDTGYLIGDFEDSDLCLKLRAANLQIAYLPSVQLTHLERQSFKLLGTGDYRTRVVIYNALRHQQRWVHLMESEFRHAPV